jgi:hypothetical protein
VAAVSVLHRSAVELPPPLPPAPSAGVFILATCAPDAVALGAGLRLVAVSDGFDRGGFGECGDVFSDFSISI